jgi:metal-responsive CopG/Arc/MetJ family transcriptional regulator
MESVTITMPPDLLDEAQKAARQQDRSVSEFFQTAVRRYLVSNEEKEALLTRVRAQAKAMGITTEEQVDELIHEWRREQAGRT